MLIFKNDAIHNVHCYFVFFGIPVVILSIHPINVFFCLFRLLKTKLKVPIRPNTSNNCSELRNSYKQQGYLDKNNSRHRVNFFPFSRHTVNFLDFSRHTLNPIKTLFREDHFASHTIINQSINQSFNVSNSRYKLE